jgi:hypothetical protein
MSPKDEGAPAVSTVLKALLERIVNDPVFRNTFIAQPRLILSAYAVSPSEHRALIRARQRLALAGSGRETPNIGEWP